ncbi:arsenate reductase/protein-tyrosine-phosphatase family protein [Paenibacillus hexagrammi]|uniref:arsenate reductase/protein-tyrosine-phosphatase family protein n=1 Tax=Paenibacillus hexagrammi TaxID=2908839 RepID=UPI0028831DAC|nr:hypothetical protein [Paenibacillus sp. YPD9-1]
MRILFVCTGNTCRSPLAEGLLRIKVQKEGLAAEVRSAGVSAFTGGDISANSASILQEAGFRIPSVLWLSKPQKSNGQISY